MKLKKAKKKINFSKIFYFAGLSALGVYFLSMILTKFIFNYFSTSIKLKYLTLTAIYLLLTIYTYFESQPNAKEWRGSFAIASTIILITSIIVIVIT